MGASASRVEQEDLIGSKFPDPHRRKSVRKFCSDDLKQYQKGYPGFRDHPDLWDNYRFYTNQLGMRPNDLTIDEILNKFSGDDEFLSRNHGLIQWLFPIREHGMNLQAQPLQLHEAQAISMHPVAKDRVVSSYAMMLQHFGIDLLDRETGQVGRASNFIERCYLFSTKEENHNLLKISRMLKSLGELNLEHLKEPWVRFLMKEILEENAYGPLFVPSGIPGRNLPSAMLTALHDFWIPLLRDPCVRLTTWLEFKSLYLRKIQTQSLSPNTRRRQSETQSGFFQRLGSLRSSLRGTVGRRSFRSSVSQPGRIEAELLDAERALTSHLVEQETKRMLERNKESSKTNDTLTDVVDSSQDEILNNSHLNAADVGSDKSDSFCIQPDVVRSTSPEENPIPV